jgi:hypothetical protein
MCLELFFVLMYFTFLLIINLILYKVLKSDKDLIFFFLNLKNLFSTSSKDNFVRLSLLYKNRKKN